MEEQDKTEDQAEFTLVQLGQDEDIEDDDDEEKKFLNAIDPENCETDMGSDQDIPTLDTTAIFDEVFQGKDKFSSWEEFVTLFEEFQRASLTVYKPRSGTHVNYANEKRVTHKIPDKFVYQKVKLICKHFGTPRVGDPTRLNHSSNFRYIGLGCKALVNLSYKKGFLHITERVLVHENHGIETEKDIEAVMRKIRPVNFNDDLDLLLAKTSDQCKVFMFKKGDDQFQTALKRLKDVDPRFEHMTLRMLKKRLQFLMDRYEENSDGLPPLSDDYLGIILNRLIDARRTCKETGGVRKRSLPKPDEDSPLGKRSVRRPARFRAADSYEEYVRDKAKYCKNRNTPYNVIKAEEDDGDDLGDEVKFDPPHFLEGLDNSDEDDAIYTRHDSPATVEKALSGFLRYLHSRDQDERALRQKEIQIRKEELQLRKREVEAHNYEMEIMREKLKFEREERQQLLELLKVQQSVGQGRVRTEIQTENGETMDIIVLSDREVEEIAKGKTTVHIEER